VDKICKKILISLLIIAMFNLLVGCYSSELLTVPEYNQIEQEDKPDEMLVISKDGQEYHFSYSNYYIENDTLYGKVSVKELPFEGKFAYSEIKSIQVESVFYTVSQYQKIEAESGKPYVIYLTKNDFTIYQFMKNDYYIENDTLYGKGKLILDDEELIDRSIALSDIESIQYEYLNGLTTTALVLGVIVVIVIIVAAESMSGFSLDFGGSWGK
jgi:hypothetical protein